jgi:hypothetical protein
MIPLERWNVERKVTSAVKGTMGKGASPHLPSPIGWMAHDDVSGVPDSLERELQLDTTSRWHSNIQVDTPGLRGLRVSRVQLYD